jgi:DivIVA domain-containing protein
MAESSVNFRTVIRGYDPVQVDHHMDELARATASAWQEAAERTLEIKDLKAANDRLKGEVNGHSQRVRALESELEEAGEPTYTGLGERIGAILTLVENETFELRTRALADAANSRALADEDSLAIRQDADAYARATRGAADDEVAGALDDARQQAEGILDEARQLGENILEDAREYAGRLRDDADREAMARQDADRQATARREEAEVVYEHARAKAAAAAVDFETTLAARREASALEFAAQVAAAEQQLAAVRVRTEEARTEFERAQHETSAKIARQLEQAAGRAQAVVAEAKTKAERIRDDAERELAATTQRRDGINAQISNVRRELAALGGTKRVRPARQEVPAADHNNGDNAAADVENQGAAPRLNSDAQAPADSRRR